MFDKRNYKPPAVSMLVVQTNKVDEGTVCFDGKSYTYAVLKQKLQPDVPCFVGLGTCEGKRLYFISDATQLEDRDSWIRHEVREFETYITCLESLHQELEEAANKRSKDSYVGYLSRRLDFFEHLVPFLKDYDDPRGPEFIAETESSLVHLREVFSVLQN